MWVSQAAALSTQRVGVWDCTTWTVVHACGFSVLRSAKEDMITLYWVRLTERPAMSSLLQIGLFSISLVHFNSGFLFFKTPNKTGQVNLRITCKCGGRWRARALLLGLFLFSTEHPSHPTRNKLLDWLGFFVSSAPILPGPTLLCGLSVRSVCS